MNIKNDDIIVTPNMEKPMNIENDDIIVTSGSGYIGSARPEVRGTAEPHGGAYPP